MKIIYIADIRLPTEKAHGVQIMKTCEALAVQGASVELVVPSRENTITADPFVYYKVARSFVVHKIDSSKASILKRFGMARLAFYIESVFFALAVMRHFKQEDAIYYSRDLLPVYILSFFRKHIFWEDHRGQWSLLTRLLVRRRIPIVVISHGLEGLYRRHGALRVFVSPDAVDLAQFQIKEDKITVRRRLGLPEQAPIVLYTGHLYSWKGADILAQAAPLLPESIKVAFVGGTPPDIERFRRDYGHIPNVMIIGHRPHADMPSFLRSADIVVIPNSAREDISRLYTSPMKLFEYMASGTPIVASDLPSIREVLNHHNAAICKPDDAPALALTIKTLLADASRRERLSRRQLSDILGYSWEARAKNLIAFISHD